jgi:hypothetical protein
MPDRNSEPISDNVLAHSMRRRKEDMQPKSCFTFNKNIDAGHVLVAASMLASVIVAGVMFQNRLVVVEEWQKSHVAETKQIKDDMHEMKRLWREDVQEIRKDVRELLISKNRVPK